MKPNASLELEKYGTFTGNSFGSNDNIAGEVVFATGMVGYPEALTDPSYAGQILVMTYPLIGNYGVAEQKTWESKKIWLRGLIVSNYIDTPSHYSSQQSLGKWLKKQGVPALEIADTRKLTQLIRTEGALLGRIITDSKKAKPKYTDPNKTNLVAEVSPKKVTVETPEKTTKKTTKIALIDCGAKQNIVNELLKRNCKVTRLPWDHDLFNNKIEFDAIVLSNGPGDPKQVSKTVATVKKALKQDIPILGICLGNQVLTLAAGGDTYKLPFGHRSQNQPAQLAGTDCCYLTTQNHSYAVNKIPAGFKTWFTNVNDGTNEGIIHETKPWMSVQFHPEARPGPIDTSFIFDLFLEQVRTTTVKKGN